MNSYLSVRHTQHMFLGMIFGVLAALFFTLMSLMTKLIGERASVDTILFSRFFISLILVFPWACKHSKEIFKVSQPIRLLFRAIFTLIALACFFYALQFISLTNGLLLNNTSPLFVPLIVLILHQVKTSHKIWIGIILGFIGIGLVLKPAGNFFHYASLIGLTSGLFSAIAYVFIRFLTKQVSILHILFYNFLICSCMTALLLPIHWKSFNSSILILLLAVGIFGAFYQFFSTLSLAKAPVRIMAPLQFLSIVFGVLADFFIWNQTPDLYGFIGIGLVILGGILTIYFGKNELDMGRKA
jgi:drug/metabolite transporter (DMT)-like permease